MSEVVTDIYTSIIVVETPEGRVNLNGPRESRSRMVCEDGICHIGTWWMMSQNTGGCFASRIDDIMKRGFYPYASGEYGRIVAVKTFLNGDPLLFHCEGGMR